MNQQEKKRRSEEENLQEEKRCGGQKVREMKRKAARVILASRPKGGVKLEGAKSETVGQRGV